MRRKLTGGLAQAAVLCAVVVVCAHGQELQTPELNPVKWSLKPATSASQVKAGEKFVLQLAAEIEDGWHLYSTEEIPQGPKPTRITLVPMQPFELSEIDSPAPQKAADPNFPVETEFYEHSVTFALSMRVKPDATPGAHSLTVQVRYQSCTETLCLLPKLVNLKVEIQISNREKAASQ